MGSVRLYREKLEGLSYPVGPNHEAGRPVRPEGQEITGFLYASLQRDHILTRERLHYPRVVGSDGEGLAHPIVVDLAVGVPEHDLVTLLYRREV